LHGRYWNQHFALCRQAIASASAGILEEAFAREDLLEGDDAISDAAFVPYRRTICLGYMAAAINSRLIEGQDVRRDSTRLLEFLRRQLPMGIWGEGVWNYQINLALALQATPHGVLVGEGIVSRWLEYACSQRPPSRADPYETAEDALSIGKQREREGDQSIEQVPVSYTGLSAAGYLARRPLRKALADRWRALSRCTHAQLVPANETDLLQWEEEDGIVELRRLPITGSWRALQNEAINQRSSLFADAEAWLLPYFLCTYAHRTNANLAGELDRRTAPEALRLEWERRNAAE